MNATEEWEIWNKHRRYKYEELEYFTRFKKSIPRVTTYCLPWATNLPLPSEMLVKYLYIWPQLVHL